MDEATLAINAHHDSINEQDVEKYLKTVKFPFTYQNHTGVSSLQKVLMIIEKILISRGTL